MRKFFGIAVMAILTALALSSAVAACQWAGYQPEVPESLLD